MRTEKVMTSIFILAIVAKLFNIPGHSILLILSSVTISILYFPLAFYFFSDKSLKNQNIAFSIIGGMALAIIPNGILFKVMFWPGAQIQLVFSFILTLILFVITLILKRNCKEDLKAYYKNYLTRIVFWLILGVTFFLVSNSTLINMQHHNDPELARLKIRAFENPSNIEYDMALQNYYRKLDSLEIVNNQQK